MAHDAEDSVDNDPDPGARDRAAQAWGLQEGQPEEDDEGLPTLEEAEATLRFYAEYDVGEEW